MHEGRNEIQKCDKQEVHDPYSHEYMQKSKNVGALPLRNGNECNENGYNDLEDWKDENSSNEIIILSNTQKSELANSSDDDDVVFVRQGEASIVNLNDSMYTLQNVSLNASDIEIIQSNQNVNINENEAEYEQDYEQDYEQENQVVQENENLTVDENEDQNDIAQYRIENEVITLSDDDITEKNNDYDNDNEYNEYNNDNNENNENDGIQYNIEDDYTLNISGYTRDNTCREQSPENFLMKSNERTKTSKQNTVTMIDLTDSSDIMNNSKIEINNNSISNPQNKVELSQYKQESKMVRDMIQESTKDNIFGISMDSSTASTLENEINILLENINAYDSTINNEKKLIEELERKKENLQHNLKNQVLELKECLKPMNYSKFGNGIKVFDSKCTDFISTAVTFLMRVKSVVKYFQKIETGKGSEEIHTIEHKENQKKMVSQVTSDVIYDLVHQYWSQENSRYAVDSTAIQFLYRYFCYTERDFNKKDLASLVYITLKCLEHENATLCNIFSFVADIPDTLCIRCGEPKFQRDESIINLELFDRQLLFPIDIIVVDQLSLNVSIHSVSVEELISGIDWKYFVQYECKKESNSQLLFCFKDLATKQFTLLSEDQTLLENNIAPNGTIIYAWVKEDNPHVGMNTKSKPEQEYITVNMMKETLEICSPFFIRGKLEDGILLVDSHNFMDIICARLKPYLKQTKMSDFWYEMVENHNIDLFLKLFTSIHFNWEQYSTETVNSFKQMKFANTEDFQHSRKNLVVPLASSGLPSIQLYTGDLFYLLFDLALLLDQSKTYYNSSWQQTRQQYQHCWDHVENALSRYFSNAKCSNCSLYMENVRHRIKIPPENLILKLDRYNNISRDPDTDNSKDCTLRKKNIMYNNIFTWMPFGFNLLDYVDIDEENFVDYEIRSIVTHEGYIGNGFWGITAMTENEKGLWWHQFHTQNCQLVDVFQALSPNIYMLAYEKLPPPPDGQVTVSVKIEKVFFGGIIAYVYPKDTVQTVLEVASTKMCSDIVQSQFLCTLSGTNRVLPNTTTIEEIYSMKEFSNSSQCRKSRIYFSLIEPNSS